MATKAHGNNRATQNQESWSTVDSIFKPAKGGTARVNLNPFAFSELIEQQGIEVKVYRTSYCPNVKSVSSGSHNIDCTLCSDGWIDLAPLTVQAILQSISFDKISSVEGFVDGNSMSITFPTGISIQYFTLIEIPSLTEIFIQRVMRNPVGDVDILKYRALRFNFLIDKNAKRYYQDQDFKIDNNGDILWITGGGATRPAANLPFSVHYEACVQFRAIRATHVNRVAQHKIGDKVEIVRFPSTWEIKKSFLLRRTDEATGAELKEGPYDDHTLVP